MKIKSIITQQVVAEGQLELNTPDPVVVVQDLKGNILDKINLSVASQKYKLGQPQNIKNQLAHQNYTKIGNYIVAAPMGGQPQDSTTQAVAEGSLNEFAPSNDNGDNEPDEYEILHRLAAMWWLGTEQQMIKAQRTLASMGWEIGEDEGYDNGGVFVVRANDEHGKSYISWPHEDLQLNEQGMAEGQLNEGEQLFYARNPDGTRTYARIKDQEQLAQLKQKYASSEVKMLPFDRPDVAEWLVSRGVNMRGFLPGMVITRGLSEEENKPESPEADYGDDYQDMVARVKKLAGMGPLKTVYDPQKRVYKNVPTAVQPGDKK